MDTPIHEAILGVLRPSEQVLWSGGPGGRIFKGGDIAAFGFMSLWTVACVGRALNGSEAGYMFLGMVLLGVPVIVAYRRTHLVYGVTNRRILIVGTGLRDRVDAYELTGMTEANILLEYVDDYRGTISFKDFAKWCGYNNDALCMPEFRGIPDAIQVAKLIRTSIAEIRQSNQRWGQGR